MKLLIMFVVLLGLYTVYIIQVQVHIDNYSSCISTAEQQRTSLGQPTCADDSSILDELRACVITVQKESAISAFLYGPTGTENKATLLIGAHNERCPEWPVPLIEEGLYL